MNPKPLWIESHLIVPVIEPISFTAFATQPGCHFSRSVETRQSRRGWNCSAGGNSEYSAIHANLLGVDEFLDSRLVGVGDEAQAMEFGLAKVELPEN